MNSNNIFIFLGVVGFFFAFLLVMSEGGILVSSASLALLLVIAFGLAVLAYLLAVRFLRG